MHPHLAKNYQTHATRRAYERYQILISPRIIRDMENRIRQNLGVVDRKRMTATRSLIDLTYSDKDYRVIYSRKWKRIVTFLPKEEKTHEANPID